MADIEPSFPDSQREWAQARPKPQPKEKPKNAGTVGRKPRTEPHEK